MKLAEIIIVVVILAILSALCFPGYLSAVEKAKLSTSISTILELMRQTRYDSIGSSEPRTICITESAKKLQVAIIDETNCEQVKQWREIASGVVIDRANSTLRTVRGVAGNNGTIYRASWADTKANLGGSYGQLGRITLQAGGNRKCVFLNNVDGSIEPKDGNKCLLK